MKIDKNDKNEKTQKDENLVLPKEKVEYVGLYKPILNKIMTIRK